MKYSRLKVAKIAVVQCNDIAPAAKKNKTACVIDDYLLRHDLQIMQAHHSLQYTHRCG